MKHLLAAVGVFLSLASFASAQPGKFNLVPKPISIVEMNEGGFRFDRNTFLVVDPNDDRTLVDLLNARTEQLYGFKLRTREKPDKNLGGIYLFATVKDHTFPSGGYELSVQKNRIVIMASDPAGRFYAVQTLLQMMPPGASKEFTVPAVVIRDAPRFKYRGMHLDISRHFQPVEFVKKFIDQMAQYKFNNFHWHLTDDQGWRIEIKKWPKLTEVGSMRPETMVERNFVPYKGDGIPHGGFYTQEQIKDVVAYAKARHINVIPEIELPGHASAALAAYPQFGCKTDYQYKVQTTWGIFKEVFCPTEETFSFLEDVLTETIALFPDSPYIHIGGDEVLKDHWKESAFVQELKKRENLKDELEVQSYFVRRIERFLSSKGRKMIGWDEILEGGLAPNATVMSWRGMRGGIEAAKSKHDVIMTPTTHVYFDYGQGDPAYEPLNIGSYV
ncbi:MAG: beta-N-acetylhexosaminidase, partial [Pyrinomonadaceae bacterium]|nr:beta-N-acetylhexosaminidase [Pyrinomonadaceae bacterium]